MRAHQSLLRGVRGRRVREQGDGKKVADSDCNSLLLSGGGPSFDGFLAGREIDCVWFTFSLLLALGPQMYMSATYIYTKF